MSKDPAILFYTQDFLVGTMMMSDEQVGQYIRLLCLQHQKGGYLTEEVMNKICGGYDPDIFPKFKKNADGLFFNQRLIDEVERRKNYSESRRQNRLKKPDNISLSHDKDMETVTENETVTKDEKRKPKVKTDFIEMWQTFAGFHIKQTLNNIGLTIVNNY